MFESTPVFVRQDEKIYLRESFSSDILRIDDCDSTVVFRVDFGKYAIPDEFFTLADGFAASDALFSGEFAVISRFLSNAPYTVIEANIQRGEGGTEDEYTVAYALRNGKNGPWIWVNHPQRLIGENQIQQDILAGTLKAINNSSEFLFLIEAHRLMAPDALEGLNVSNAAVLSELDIDSDPVILKAVPR
jgi:hypothetical protein